MAASRWRASCAPMAWIAVRAFSLVPCWTAHILWQQFFKPFVLVATTNPTQLCSNLAKRCSANEIEDVACGTRLRYVPREAVQKAGSPRSRSLTSFACTRSRFQDILTHPSLGIAAEFRDNALGIRPAAYRNRAGDWLSLASDSPANRSRVATITENKLLQMLASPSARDIPASVDSALPRDWLRLGARVAHVSSDDSRTRAADSHLLVLHFPFDSHAGIHI